MAKIIAFHGTGSWSDISEKGYLDPAPVDQCYTDLDGGLRSCGGAYLTSDIEIAVFYALRAAQEYTSEPTIIAVEIDTADLVPDEDKIWSEINDAVGKPLGPSSRTLKLSDVTKPATLAKIAQAIGYQSDDFSILEAGLKAFVDRHDNDFMEAGDINAINQLCLSCQAAFKSLLEEPDGSNMSLTFRCFDKIGLGGIGRIQGAATALFDVKGFTLERIDIDGEFDDNDIFVIPDAIATHSDVEIDVSNYDIRHLQLAHNFS